MTMSLCRETWNWLPAFLEIADSGSVVAAARRLGLTPAAVSRTLRLLEDHLGAEVFNRVGRALVLNSRGAVIQAAVRAAVAGVERGLRDALEDPFSGPLRIASLGVVTEHFVVPELIALKRAHPELVPEHVHVGTREANAQLARGELDLALHYEALTAEGVTIERLGATTMSVYCGPRHPLFGKKRVTRQEVLAHPFSVPQIGDSGRIQDGWPVDHLRATGMRVTLLQSNLQVCRSGILLTVLPDVVARAAGGLRRLPFDALPVIEVFAARATNAVARASVVAIIDGVRARLRQSMQSPRPGKRLARNPVSD